MGEASLSVALNGCAPEPCGQLPCKNVEVTVAGQVGHMSEPETMLDDGTHMPGANRQPSDYDNAPGARPKGGEA